MNYDLHELCSVFPKMSGYEFECLKLDIKENGLLNPIILYKNTILDGQNRYNACVELGINPMFEKFVGDAISEYVETVNLHRRHLPVAQIAVIVSRLQDWRKSHKLGDNQHTQKSRVVTNNNPPDTLKTRSNKSGASLSTQRKADAVAKANPELAAKVARGEVSLNDATREVAPQLVAKKVDHVEPEHNPDEEKNIWIESLQAQEEQITALKDRQAVSVMDIPANERIDVLEEMKSLRTELKTAHATIDAITKSRDSFQRQCAEMDKQLKTYKRKLDKLEEKK